MTGTVEGAISDNICKKAWLPISYDSKKDTAQTVTEVKANNRAQKAFCTDAAPLTDQARKDLSK